MGSKFLSKEKFPPFLIVLVLLYIWERYSYYCMRSILSLYMTQPDQMNLPDSYAYGISALFNAIGYMIPLIAGFLADKYFGFQIIMLTGALILTLGHFLMILAIFSDLFFFLGIAGVSLGTGLFKGNITSLLGACYDKFPSMDRTAGFTLFYAAVNTGSLLASISSGYIATYVSYHLAFGLAGFYMLIGLTIYLYNRNIFTDKDKIRRPEIASAIYLGFIGWRVILAILFAISLFPVAALYYYAQVVEKINIVLWIGIIVILILIYLGFRTKGSRNRRNYIILMCYFFNLFVFTAIELQLNTLFMLFISRHVYQFIGNLHVPPSVATSVNPFVIVVCGVLMTIFYKHPIKWDVPRMGIAILLNSLCFFVLYWGTLNVDPVTSITSYVYPLTGIFLMALGEILLAPLMSSSTTRYAPDGTKGIMIGMYLSIQGVAGLTEYLFGKIFSVPTDNEGNFNVKESLEIYKRGFLQVGLYNLIPVFITILFYPLVRYLSNPTEEEKTQNQKTEAFKYIESAS